MLRADTERQGPLRSARETWFDHGLLALALVLLLTGFGTIVEGSDWWVTTMLVALMTGMACAVLRGLGFRLVAPVAIVVELLAITWIFVPETLLSIVPTPETFSALKSLGASAQKIIIEEQAPVGAAKPIVLVVAGSFGLIVILADALLQRRRAAPLLGVLLLAVFVTPALISGQTPSVWLFLAVAAIWLVLLRSRISSTGLAGRGAGPAMVLGTAALAGAVVFPSVAPDISAVATSWGKPPPTVFGRGINPMLELGQNLRRNGTSTALTYTTTFDEAQYLKVATLRDFTGRSWRPVEDEGSGGMEGEVDINRDIETERGETTVTIRQLRSSMLPVPYPPGSVTGIEGGTRIQRPGLTVMAREDDVRGETYTVSSLDVRPTAEQMRALPSNAGPGLSAYLRLPSNMPDVIAQTARQVTADADNDYDRAMALQTFFRNTDFTYSETAPVAGDYDGNGVDVIAEFLDVKAGYCVHFSSAMAVMARTLDIPSRIAVGYAPGSTSGVDDGETEYRNTSDDLHAWTELYFRGAGWVRFDPTASVGNATRFVEPVLDTPDVESEPTQAPEPVTPRGGDQLDDTAVAPVEQTSTAPRTAIVTIIGILLLGALPWFVRFLRSRWRLARGRHDVEPLWRELEDVARDHGVQTSAGDTPRGFASRLGGRPGIDAEALDALLRRVEQARFSRDASTTSGGVDDLVAVVRSVRDGATGRQRLRATLLPQSLGGRARVASVPRPGPVMT